MKSKKNSYPPVNIGTSFMLVILIILCMIIFAVLSFSTALRDYHSSQETAERTNAYYEANNLAQKKLGQIDKEIADGTISESTVEFLVPISESEVLQVVLLVHPDESTRYTIVKWAKVSTAEWEGNETLPVLGSE